MSLRYTIATDGARMTLTLTRGRRMLAEVTARPEEGAHELILTAQNWRAQQGAAPRVLGPPELWAALPELFRQTLNECKEPSRIPA